MARETAPGHRKTLALADALGLPKPYALGLLETLWHRVYAAGDPGLGSSRDVELAAEWPGERGKLTEALLNCGGQGSAGFIETDPDREGCFRIHDLFDHCPGYVAKRAEREAERRAKGMTLSEIRSLAGRKGRAAQLAGKHPASDGQAADACPSTAQQNAALPTPSPSPSQETLTPRSASADAAQQPALLTFPCAGGGKGVAATWSLTDTHAKELQETFPEMDILAECRKALLWVKANRKKTSGGMARFLANWCIKAQNRGDFARRRGAAPAMRPAAATVAEVQRAARDTAFEACKAGRIPPHHRDELIRAIEDAGTMPDVVAVLAKGGLHIPPPRAARLGLEVVAQ
jgi:hypothetical protein